MQLPKGSFVGDGTMRAENALGSEEAPLNKMAAGIYHRKEIGLMLLADAVARKEKKWILLNSKEILDLSQRLFGNKPFPFSFNGNELLVVGDESIRALRSPFDPFRKQFIFVDTILNAFPGKLVVAGGSIFKAFLGNKTGVRRQLDFDGLLHGSDVDFFFINCTKEEVEEIIRFAWELVTNREKRIKLMGRKHAYDEDITHEYDGCVDRCQNTTTIYYVPGHMGDINWLAENWEFEDGGKMQFIHRSYPDPASVIGGFDLGPCMAFYDGIDFYATPFGAWSIATQTIILDVSRRSTSFEYRISKYATWYRCRLIIVNGSTHDLYHYLDKEDERQKMRSTRSFFPVKGLKITSRHVPDAKFARDLENDGFSDEEGLSDENDDEEQEEVDMSGTVGVHNPELMTMVQQMTAKMLSGHGLTAPVMQTMIRNNVPFYLNGFRTDVDTPEVRRQRTIYEKEQEEQNRAVYLNKFRCRFDGRNGISDYDGGQFNTFNVTEANAVFAARGKVDCMTWRSNKTEEIFQHPRIETVIRRDLSLLESPDLMENHCYVNKLRRWFPEETVKSIVAGPMIRPQLVPVHRDILYEALVELHQKVKENRDIAQRRAEGGITLITENPGRQWTASNNPVVGNVRDYYHPAILNTDHPPLLIGIPHNVFGILHAAWKVDGAGCEKTWRRLPRDVFRLIMRYVWRDLAAEGNEYLMGQRRLSIV